MRVVVVCDGASITGGTEQVAINTALELDRRGIETAFFGAEGQLDKRFEGTNIRRESLNLTDAYHTDNKLELLRRFFWNKEAAEKFLEFIKPYSPQDTVLHFHSFRRILSTSVPMAAKKLGFKTIQSLHDFGMLCPNTGYYRFPEQQICSHKPMSRQCWTCQCTHSGWKMKAMQMGRAMVLKRTGVLDLMDGIITVSRHSRDVYTNELGFKRETETIYYPVSSIREPKADASKNEAFIYVGRFVPEKDPVTVALAAKKIGAPCIFVGDGPERDNIVRANPDAVLTGWLRPDQVAEKIRSARALVMSSRWYETAGLVVIEAVSRGIPAIVANRCASQEYIAEGVSGFLFEPGNVDDLAEKMQMMTPEFAREAGGAAYLNYWIDPLTIEKHVDRVVNLYERVLRGEVRAPKSI